MKLIVLLIILAILAIILLMPVGVDSRYNKSGFILDAKIGPIKFSLYPEKKEDGVDTGFRKLLKTALKPKEKPAEQKAPLTKEDILSYLKMIVRASAKVHRKLSVDYLELHYTAAASDPFKAAMQYGKVSAFFGVAVPLIDQAFNIQERDLDIQMSFELEKPAISAQVIATIQVWEVLYTAISFGAESLKMKNKRREA